MDQKSRNFHKNQEDFCEWMRKSSVEREFDDSHLNKVALYGFIWKVNSIRNLFSM